MNNIFELDLEENGLDLDLLPFYTLTDRNGYMEFYLETLFHAINYHNKKDFYYKIYYIKSDETNIVGWVLIQDLLYRHQDYCDLNIYVDPNFRCRGYAHALMTHVEQNVDRKINVWVNRYSDNEKFFKQFNHHPFTLFDSDHYFKTQEFKQLYLGEPWE